MSLFFSIQVPVCNSAKYLHECIDSILGQTYKNFELICCDDASTDSSYNILQSYALVDKKIRILRHDERQGIFTTRNDLIRATNCNAEYILHIDSDDRVSSELLEKIVLIAESGLYDLIEVPFQAFSSESVKIPFELRNTYSGSISLYLKSAIFEFFFFLQKYPWHPWGKAFRREILQHSMLPDMRVNTGDDAIRMVAFLSETSSYCYIGKSLPLYFYRYGSGETWMSCMNLSQFSCRCLSLRTVRDTIIQLLRTRELPLKYEKCIRNEFNDFISLRDLLYRICPDDFGEACRIFQKYWNHSWREMVEINPLPVRWNQYFLRTCCLFPHMISNLFRLAFVKLRAWSIVTFCRMFRIGKYSAKQK